MIVNLDKKDIKQAITLAKRFSKKDQWSKKNNEFYRWGSGILNSGKIPYKAELIGIIGEIAFSKVSNIPVDCEYKKNGNSHDFKADILNSRREVDIEIKTRLKDYGDVYLKRYDESSKLIKLKSDIYVFCHLKTAWNKIESHLLGNDSIEEIKVCIDGVISKKKLKTKSIQPAFNGTHKNIVCSTNELADINKLIEVMN
tara:strand:- start:858 stop:1454 length:597 start_codon:yes stop_codon:yes gene_type:complete